MDHVNQVMPVFQHTFQHRSLWNWKRVRKQKAY
jgi:hypothetical protein